MSVPLRLRARFGTPEDEAARPEPVTVTVARVVRAEPREAFERWAEDVLRGGVPLSRQPRRQPAAPGAGQLRVPPGLPLRGRPSRWPPGSARRSAGRRWRTSRTWSTTSATSGCRAGELLHPRTAAGPAVADDGADHRGRLRDHVAVPAVRHAVPGVVAARTAAALSAVVVVLLLGHVLMPALTRCSPAGCTPAADLGTVVPAA